MTPKEILSKILEVYQLKVTEYKGWLLVEEQLPALNASIQNLKNYGDHIGLQLDIAVMLKSKQILWESFSGMGKDEQTALQNAFESFSTNSLPVFLSAFWDIQDHYDQVGIEQWTISASQWKVYIGNLDCKGNFNIPENLFSTIEETITNTYLDQKINWFRLYFAHINENKTMIEALKNNKPCLSLQKAIAKIDWQKTDKFYSLRNFILLKKIE